MTTIGFKEAADVAKAFEYCKAQFTDEQLILFGPSMGAVSILKAVDEFTIKPDKIIIECPFGSMLKTTKIRFSTMGMPTFPFAELLLFYGGLQTGFNAFEHIPVEYAKAVNVPTLLLYGAKDARVSREEIDAIFFNLKGKKKLVIFEHSAHEIYLNDEAEKWVKEVGEFLNE
ncbi:MAG: prolyl oligopeptidase family serine peptidase [Bacteroidia bacterium]